MNIDSEKESIQTRSSLVISQRAATIILLLILVIAAGLRLYQLNSGLWLDEYLTLLRYARLPFGSIITTFDSENQHFLYSLLAHLSFLIFGESAWALRLPAVFLGLGSILGVYLFGIEVANRNQGLLAAALMTFSYHHVWFSQNARGYSGLLFWTLISSWLLLISLKTRKKRTWILFAVSVSLGVYTHLTMLFVVLGQFAYFAAYYFQSSSRNRNDILIGFIFGFLLSGILTLIFYSPVFSDMRSVIGGSEVSVVTEWKNPLWTIREFVTGLNVSFTSGILAAGALSVFFAGLLSYWRDNFKFLLIFLIPPIVGAGFVIIIGHHLWPRFFFFAFGFACLIIVRGAMIIGKIIARVFRYSTEKAVLIGTVLNIGIIIFSALSLTSVYGPKQDFQGALEYVQENLADGDAVVTVSLTSMIYHDYYKTNWIPVSEVDELDEIRSISNRTWIVYTFIPVLSSVSPEIMNTIENDFMVMAKFKGTVREGTIFVAVSESS